MQLVRPLSDGHSQPLALKNNAAEQVDQMCSKIFTHLFWLKVWWCKSPKFNFLRLFCSKNWKLKSFHNQRRIRGDKEKHCDSFYYTCYIFSVVRYCIFLFGISCEFVIGIFILYIFTFCKDWNFDLLMVCKCLEKIFVRMINFHLWLVIMTSLQCKTGGKKPDKHVIFGNFQYLSLS